MRVTSETPVRLAGCTIELAHSDQYVCSQVTREVRNKPGTPTAAHRFPRPTVRTAISGLTQTTPAEIRRSRRQRKRPLQSNSVSGALERGKSVRGFGLQHVTGPCSAFRRVYRRVSSSKSSPRPRPRPRTSEVPRVLVPVAPRFAWLHPPLVARKKNCVWEPDGNDDLVAAADPAVFFRQRTNFPPS